MPSRSYKGGEEERVEAPNKSGKSFDIKIVSPSRRPTNKLFYDQTLHLMIIIMMTTEMILTIFSFIRMMRMVMRAVVENR